MEKNLLKAYCEGIKQIESIIESAIEAIYKEDIALNLKLYKVSSLNERLESIKTIKEYVDENGFVSYIPDVSLIYFFATMYCDILNFTNNDIVKLVLLAIGNNINLLQTPNEYYIKFLENDIYALNYVFIYRSLENYIKKDGSIAPNVNKEFLCRKVRKLIFPEFIDDRIKEDLMTELSNLLPDAFIKIVERMAIDREDNKVLNHDSFVDSKQPSKKDEKNTNAKIKDDSYKQMKKNYCSQIEIERKRKEALKNLSEYYFDGKVIAIPSSIEDFAKILEKCGYNLEKEKKILDKMKKFIASKEQELLYKKYLNDLEYEVYKTGLNNLENDDISYFIGEIDTAIDIAETISSEQEEMKKYIVDNISRLNVLINTISKHKHYN